MVYIYVYIYIYIYIYMNFIVFLWAIDITWSWCSFSLYTARFVSHSLRSFGAPQQAILEYYFGAETSNLFVAYYQLSSWAVGSSLLHIAMAYRSKLLQAVQVHDLFHVLYALAVLVRSCTFTHRKLRIIFLWNFYSDFLQRLCSWLCSWTPSN